MSLFERIKQKLRQIFRIKRTSEILLMKYLKYKITHIEGSEIIYFYINEGLKLATADRKFKSLSEFPDKVRKYFMDRGLTDNRYGNLKNEVSLSTVLKYLEKGDFSPEVIFDDEYIMCETIWDYVRVNNKIKNVMVSENEKLIFRLLEKLTKLGKVEKSDSDDSLNITYEKKFENRGKIFTLRMKYFPKIFMFTVSEALMENTGERRLTDKDGNEIPKDSVLNEINLTEDKVRRDPEYLVQISYIKRLTENNDSLSFVMEDVENLLSLTDENYAGVAVNGNIGYIHNYILMTMQLLEYYTKTEKSPENEAKLKEALKNISDKIKEKISQAKAPSDYFNVLADSTKAL